MLPAQQNLFSLLPIQRAPWRQLLFSTATQSLAVLGVAFAGLLYPQGLLFPKRDYHFVQLVNTPPPVNHEPAPVRVIKPILVEAQPLRETLHLPPEVRRERLPDELPTAPKVNLAATKPVLLPPSAAPAIPRPLVKTNVFSTGSSAAATVATASQVQTGGFGDPNGVPARETNGRPVTIARLGSFDLPSGPGNGNGSGGASGVPGVVASAGFGNGIATGRAGNTQGSVRESNFGDVQVASAAPLAAKTAGTATPKAVAPEIVSKPLPVYTEEARKLRIEGEVLLEVVLEASGNVRVVRVVRGLGHGLDEAAVRAAEGIRFKPSMRDGQPADFSAVLHIVFQLA